MFRRVDRLILSHRVQPVRHNPPGKTVIDTSIAYGLTEIWTKVYSPEPGTGLTFPQTVHSLSELGVTRYRVDFVTNTAIAYIGGSAHIYHFPSYATEEITPGAIPWSLVKVRAAIKKAREDAKNLKPDLPNYTRQIVEAGVCDYTCFIEGARVTYSGYLGEQHSAWFMGGGPEIPASAAGALVRRNTASGDPYSSRAAAHPIASSPLRGNTHTASEHPRPVRVHSGIVGPHGTNGFASTKMINGNTSAIISDDDVSSPTSDTTSRPPSFTIATPASSVASTSPVEPIPTLAPDPTTPIPVTGSDLSMTVLDAGPVPVSDTDEPTGFDRSPPHLFSFSSRRG